MLQINVDVSDHEHDDRVSTKKANKPLMEKKRRARINRCLYEMKQMLVESSKNGSASHSKWEKADILEMSVAYIRQLQTQASKCACNEMSRNSQFIDGYAECMKEVKKFSSVENCSIEVLEHNSRLNSHLNGTLLTHKRKPQPKMDSYEEPPRHNFITGGEASPSHSQTSPSLASSGTPSPCGASPDTSDHLSMISSSNLKRRRKSSGRSDNRAVPLPSTLCIPRPLPNRSTAVPPGPEPKAPMLPGLDPSLLARFLETSSQLIKYPSPQQWPIATNTPYYGGCNDLLTLNSLWSQNLWRPF